MKSTKLESIYAAKFNSLADVEENFFVGGQGTHLISHFGTGVSTANDIGTDVITD